MQVLQVLISGISQGCIYGLIALGFVLIYKATETVNFAQGELMMLGAFIGLTATVGMGLSYWAAIPIALAGMAWCGSVVTGFGMLLHYQAQIGAQDILLAQPGIAGQLDRDRGPFDSSQA